MLTKLVVMMMIVVIMNMVTFKVEMKVGHPKVMHFIHVQFKNSENLAKAEIQMKTSNLLESNKSLLRSLNTKSQRFQIYLNNQTDFLEHKSKSHPLSAYSTFTNFASRGMTRRIKHSIPFDIDVLPTKTCYCWLNSA